MVEVVFLGTGSAVPTVKRNHPGILLKYKTESILFDCGEGIQRQFRIAKENPCKLTRLFITHWHGDHVLGIPGLFQTLALNGYDKTLEVYGPKGTKIYVSKILSLFANVNKIKFNIKEVSSGKIIDSEDFFVESFMMEHNTHCLAYRFVEKDKLRIDKKKLEKLKVGHDPKLALIKKGKDITINGKKIRAKDITYLEKGKKIGIVLDTRENKNIYKVAKDCDLFICESTFINESDIAKKYFHLTAEQSAKISKKSKVGKLALMHLSQRYEKKENEVLNIARGIFKNTELARDFMRFEI
ncbi:ribonuclease Z [Candidatus Pacearchaeota archaeon CG_4_10_14_0_2_um_filter_05_32_18]|nr:MAG: ribonuclease Z [Candidatus Pacearchaeota archaeon CG1_02_32_21]PIZ83428.1 MAG: ribonuclease Z [Candidatus Pacearchaeota archaeon CG_4_10_14_0_2_um_filter_05_32_18]